MEVSQQQVAEVRQFVENVAKVLVETPEQVRVEAVTVNPMVTAFTIYSGPNEAGFVIGRKGRLINAIRLLVDAIGRKHCHIYKVEVAGGNN